MNIALETLNSVWCFVLAQYVLCLQIFKVYDGAISLYFVFRVASMCTGVCAVIPDHVCLTFLRVLFSTFVLYSITFRSSEGGPFLSLLVSENRDMSSDEYNVLESQSKIYCSVYNEAAVNCRLCKSFLFHIFYETNTKCLVWKIFPTVFSLLLCSPFCASYFQK